MENLITVELVFDMHTTQHYHVTWWGGGFTLMTEHGRVEHIIGDDGSKLVPEWLANTIIKWYYTETE